MFTNEVLIIIVYLTRQCLYLFIPIKSVCERKLNFYFWNKVHSHGFIKNQCIINLVSSSTNTFYYFFDKNLLHSLLKNFYKNRILKSFKYSSLRISYTYLFFLKLIFSKQIFILIASNRAYSTGEIINKSKCV